MRNATKITAFAGLLLLATGAWAATPAELENILGSNEFSLEQLVDFGAQSEEAAAQVMEATARRYPHLLKETTLGLALRMEEGPFYTSVDVAIENLGDEPYLQELLATAKQNSEHIAFRTGDDECSPGNRGVSVFDDRFPGLGENSHPRSLPRGIAICNGTQRIGSDLDGAVPGPVIPDPMASPS